MAILSPSSSKRFFRDFIFVPFLCVLLALCHVNRGVRPRPRRQPTGRALPSPPVHRAAGGGTPLPSVPRRIFHYADHRVEETQIIHQKK